MSAILLQRRRHIFPIDKCDLSIRLKYCGALCVPMSSSQSSFNLILYSFILECWQIEATAINNFKRCLTALNTHLASRTYLVGESVTLADIIMTCNLTNPFHVALTKEFTSEFPHVERYFWTLVNQPNFKKVIGEITQATKPLGPPPAKGHHHTHAPGAAEKEGKAATKKEEKAPKAKKEKAPPAPKPAPAPESVDDDEEAAPVKKAKNSLDLLPPSPMVLDNWKRLYSNTKAKDFHLAISGTFLDLHTFHFKSRLLL